MHGLTNDEILFYALVWACAFVPAVGRSLWDTDIGGIRRGSALGVTGGCLAMAIVSISLGRVGLSGLSGSPAIFLGASILIGFMGKEQDRLARWAFARGAKMLGIPTEDPEKAGQDKR